MRQVFFGVLILFVLIGQNALAEASALEPKTGIPFAGMLDFRQAHAQVRVGNPKGARGLVLDAVMTGRGAYHLKMDIAHAALPNFDVAAIIEGDIRVVGENPRTREFTGELKSSYMLLNYIPFRDARLKFAVRDRKLIIESLWAGGVSGSGEIRLTGKREVNLNVEVVLADIEEIAMLVRASRGMSSADPLGFSGMMKGVLNLSGEWPRPHMQGRLSAYNGNVQAFDFDTISLDFDGHFPLINIREALITQAQGLSFRLAGQLDITDPASIVDQIKLFRKAPMISSDDNRREWVFKRLATSDEARTEMKCLYLKNDRGDTEAVLGIQKSIGF